MDKTLERVLSLLPRKEDGSFAHGAKKEFAQNIGYSSGEIVSMWINGSSSSYKAKLHEIALKYNVSVEWLEGQTDEKIPHAVQWNSEGDPVVEEVFRRVLSATPEEKKRILDVIRAMMGDV